MTNPQPIDNAYAGLFLGAARRAGKIKPCPECGPRFTEVQNPIEPDRPAKRVPVPCPHQEAEAEETARREARRMDCVAFRSRYAHLRSDAFLSGKPPFLALGSLDGRASTAQAAKVARQFFRSWPQPITSGRGVSLFGPVGVGKTAVAMGIAKAVDREDFRVVAIRERDLVRELRAEARTGEETVWTGLMVADLVVLDEIGHGKLSEWGVSEILDLIQARHERGRPIVTTGNHDAASLRRHFRHLLEVSGVAPTEADERIERAFSRLAERQVFVPVLGADQRRAGG